MDPSPARTEVPQAARKSRSTRPIRKLRRAIASKIIPSASPPLLKLLAASWRVERIDEHNLHETRARGGALFSIWHGRMIVALPTHRGEGLSVLVSPSDDGGLITTPLEAFGYEIVRGSKSRGGARALRELLACLESGRGVVVTPDGPRGPRHGMNEGLAWMARATGRPVVPCGFACDDAWHLKSWDRCCIPKVRARVAIVYGSPLWLDREASPDEMAAFSESIRSAMLGLERRGFERLGVPPDFDE